MNLAHWLWRRAQRQAETPALFTGTRCIADYGGFAQLSGAFAAALIADYKIEPGERVALFLSNDVNYLPALFGTWAAGAVAVPVNAKLHAREAAWIISDSGAKVCVVDADSEAAMKGLPAAERPATSFIAIEGPDFAKMLSGKPIAEPVERTRDDLAWLFYTSGTTGRPKGVMLSNGNLQAMTYAYLADVDQPPEGGATIYAAPISHGAGLYCLPHVLKGSAHVVPESGGFDADELLALSKHFGGVSTFAAPTMVKRLVDRAVAVGAKGEGLETIIYGGGPMYVADIEHAVEVMGPRFVQIYGQGESPMTITTLSRARVADRKHPRWRDRLGSVGTPHSCVEVRVAGADGRALPAGETGEILVRGATVMQGYWNRPDASAATLRDDWLWTGDMGSLDEDGFLTLKDRSKDVIISGGSNIYPREVEEVLLTHESVAEACVVGRPHPEWGEEVIAFIVPRESVEPKPADLDNLCLEQIARFKRPKQYRFVSSLPKNNYGKVLKTELRDLLAQD
jgi:long-chain acyl-CoA synthetase